MIVRGGMGSAPAVIISGGGRRAELGGDLGDLTEAWKQLTSNIGTRVKADVDRVELALKVAAYASAAAAVFSAISAFDSLFGKRR